MLQNQKKIEINLIKLDIKLDTNNGNAHSLLNLTALPVFPKVIVFVVMITFVVKEVITVISKLIGI